MPSTRQVLKKIEEVNKALQDKGAPPNMIKDEFGIMCAWASFLKKNDPVRFFVIFESGYQNLIIGELVKPEVGNSDGIIGFTKVFMVDRSVPGVNINFHRGDFTWNYKEDNMLGTSDTFRTYGVLPIDTTNPDVLEYIKLNNPESEDFQPWRFVVPSIGPGENPYQCNISGGSRYRKRPKKKTRRVKTKKNKKRKSSGKNKYF